MVIEKRRRMVSDLHEGRHNHRLLTGTPSNAIWKSFRAPERMPATAGGPGIEGAFTLGRAVEGIPTETRKLVDHHDDLPSRPVPARGHSSSARSPGGPRAACWLTAAQAYEPVVKVGHAARARVAQAF
jgi:hypothetical protein